MPDVLREALFSEPNSDFIWKTCQAENIPNERIYEAARISGYVLMGFLHPEDMAEQFQEAMGLDKRTADSVQTALIQRIFTPLQQEITAVYAPLSKFEVKSETVAASPAPMPTSTAPTPMTGISA